MDGLIEQYYNLTFNGSWQSVLLPIVISTMINYSLTGRMATDSATGSALTNTPTLRNYSSGSCYVALSNGNGYRGCLIVQGV